MTNHRGEVISRINTQSDFRREGAYVALAFRPHNSHRDRFRVTEMPSLSVVINLQCGSVKPRQQWRDIPDGGGFHSDAWICSGYVARKQARPEAAEGTK